MAPPSPNAGGSWFYNKNTGQIQHANLAQMIIYEAQSWMVPFNTQAEAQAYKAAFPPGSKVSGNQWWLDTSTGIISGPLSPSTQLKPPWMSFATQADAQAYEKAHPPNFGVPGITNPLGSAGTALTDLSGFVSALSQKQTWLRIAEGLLGLTMIAIGLTMIAKGTPVGNAAAKTVKTATKVIK